MPQDITKQFQDQKEVAKEAILKQANISETDMAMINAIFESMHNLSADIIPIFCDKIERLGGSMSKILAARKTGNDSETNESDIDELPKRSKRSKGRKVSRDEAQRKKQKVEKALLSDKNHRCFITFQKNISETKALLEKRSQKTIGEIDSFKPAKQVVLFQGTLLSNTIRVSLDNHFELEKGESSQIIQQCKLNVSAYLTGKEIVSYLKSVEAEKREEVEKALWKYIAARSKQFHKTKQYIGRAEEIVKKTGVYALLMPEVLPPSSFKELSKTRFETIQEAFNEAFGDKFSSVGF